MRFFFTGPRILGIRPGISLSPSDFRRTARRANTGGAMTGSFVYVVQGAGGHHKIGVSTDPIARLAQLQTGSHQSLDFAYIGVTPGEGFNIERAAHDLLQGHRQSGEWFSVPASIAIGSVIEAAKRLGEPIQQVAPETVPQIIQLANQPDAPPAPSRMQRFWRWTLWVLIAIFVALCLLVYFAPEKPSSQTSAGPSSPHQQPRH